jgi:hypothetical protein
MTQTITEPPEAPTGSAHPTNALMNLIVAFLAPVFLGITGGDLTMARMAAIETINDYRARNQADLIAIAQIILCGLAALGSLSQSMDDSISLSMVLRLRGSAVSLNRSAEQNRRVLRQPLPDTPNPYHAVMAPETPADDDNLTPPEPFLSAAAIRELAAEAQARLQSPESVEDDAPTPDPENTKDPANTKRRDQEMWAIAMVKEASEINAGIFGLPPAERSAASLRAAILGSTANNLLTRGGVPPPIPDQPDLAP